MTVIAVRDGIIACDSRWSLSGSLMSDNNIKLITYESSGFVLGADSMNANAAIMKWMRTKYDVQQRLELNATIIGLHYEHLSKIYFMDYNYNLTAHDIEFYAIGTGGQFAMGAMAHGASATEAVEAACDHDNFSAGPIHYCDARDWTVEGGAIKQLYDVGTL